VKVTSFALSLRETTSHSARRVPLSLTASATFARVEGLQTQPLGSIPATQAYYWHHLWQAGERETLESLAQGNGHRFGSAREAILWLLSDD
jgi:hypothetical protein